MRLTTAVLGTILACTIVFGSCETLDKKSTYEPQKLEYNYKMQEHWKDEFGNEYHHFEQTIKKAGLMMKILELKKKCCLG